MGLLPQIADGTGVDIATAGHYVSAYALGVVVGAPLIAVMFAAKVPRKGVLMTLMGFFALSHVAIAFADTYPSVMAARFLAGLPHGAFFGIGSVVAASLVSHRAADRRRGDPARWSRGRQRRRRAGRDPPRPAVVVAPALCRRGPRRRPHRRRDRGLPARASAPSGEESMRSEMRALRRPQVWLALLIGVVGFGGMFAMYSFITPTMTELAGLEGRYIPWVLAAYGIGMVTRHGAQPAASPTGSGCCPASSSRSRSSGCCSPSSGGRRRALARRRHGLRARGAALDRRAPAADPPARRRPRGPVARRGAQPLDAQHGQRARCLARLDRARRSAGATGRRASSAPAWPLSESPWRCCRWHSSGALGSTARLRGSPSLPASEHTACVPVRPQSLREDPRHLAPEILHEVRLGAAGQGRQRSGSGSRDGSGTNPSTCCGASPRAPGAPTAGGVGSARSMVSVGVVGVVGVDRPRWLGRAEADEGG